MKALEINNLTKKYEGFKLDDVNLCLESGMIIGLIGENGAGKTTLIKSILNIINFDNGDVKIMGMNYHDNEKAIKEEIGVVLDNMFFPEILTAKDIDNIMKGIHDKWNSSLFCNYLAEFDLPNNKIIKKLSKGMRKKLEIAVALAREPKILILDEPTSGLDPIARREILDIFLKFIADEEHTIFLSTHLTSDLEHIADRIVFLDNGRILLDENKDDIIDNYGIVKCDEKVLETFDKKDILRYRKRKYACEVLVSNRMMIEKKYSIHTIDKITLEDLMFMMLKGERL